MKYLKKYESYTSNTSNKSLGEFLSNKSLNVKDTKFSGFLYHSTNVHPSKFKLDLDYDASVEVGNENTYECDIPPGVLFLTNDIREAKSYGRYIIPCEVKIDSYKVFEVDTDNPSCVFDDDFMGYGGYGMYSTLMNEAYDMIEVRGRSKSTFVVLLDVIIPRTDLAMEYYG